MVQTAKTLGIDGGSPRRAMLFNRVFNRNCEYPVPPVREGSAGIDQVEITYQLFSGVEQPQPSPGPLAETVRSVMELHPGALRARHHDLQQRLRTLIGEAPAAEAAS